MQRRSEVKATPPIMPLLWTNPDELQTGALNLSAAEDVS
jgi:hypothetical protein